MIDLSRVFNKNNNAFHLRAKASELSGYGGRNYSIENEEDFADGGPPIAHWRAIIMELQEYRAKNKKGTKTL